jgi:hypothetical protein
MALTTSQLTALKAAIAANTNTIPAGHPWSGAFVGQQINTLANGSDQNAAIAGWYNLQASPSFTVWKTNVSLTEIGDKIDGTELEGLASLPLTRLQTIGLYSAAGVNPSLADRRAFFDGVFNGAGGVTTRPNLLALWKLLATNAQKLANFSTGTGSDGSPATLAANISQTFLLTAAEVESARNLP